MARVKTHTKSKTRTTSKANTLSGMVDQFGLIRDELKKLKKKDKNLAEKLKEILVEGNSVKGDIYKVTSYEKSRRSLDPKKVFDLLKQFTGSQKKALEIFFNICDVSISKANTVLPSNEVTKSEGDTKTYIALRYEKLDK